MNFESKKIANESLGERLRKIREKENLSRQDLAEITKIRPEYIRALEEGDFASLPEEVYARGFLISCAKNLRTDPEPLLRLFQWERSLASASSAEKKENKPLSLRPRRRRFFNASRFLILGALFLSIAAVIWYLYSALSAFVSSPYLLVSEPENSSRTQTSIITVKGQTDPAAVLTVNGRPTPVARDGSFQTEVTLSRGGNVITVVAANRFEKKSEEVRRVYFDAPPPEKPSGTLTVKGLNEPTRVKVETDEGEVWEGILAVDEEKTFSGRKATVSAEKGRNVSVRINRGESTLLSAEAAPTEKKVFDLSGRDGEAAGGE